MNHKLSGFIVLHVASIVSSRACVISKACKSDRSFSRRKVGSLISVTFRHQEDILKQGCRSAIASHGNGDGGSSFPFL